MAPLLRVLALVFGQLKNAGAVGVPSSFPHDAPVNEIEPPLWDAAEHGEVVVNIGEIDTSVDGHEPLQPYLEDLDNGQAENKAANHYDHFEPSQSWDQPAPPPTPQQRRAKGAPLRAELDGLTLGRLFIRAQDAGLDAESIAKALDAESPSQ
eukprot:COSAG01_NODE_12799_length_1683_cov_2.226641_1_plen_151_part_10